MRFVFKYDIILFIMIALIIIKNFLNFSSAYIHISFHFIYNYMIFKLHDYDEIEKRQRINE